MCHSHCVFAEERESWFLSCCRIVTIVPCDFLIVSLQKKERAGFFLAAVFAIVPCVYLIVSLQKKERAGFFLAVV